MKTKLRTVNDNAPYRAGVEKLQTLRGQHDELLRELNGGPTHQRDHGVLAAARRLLSGEPVDVVAHEVDRGAIEARLRVIDAAKRLQEQEVERLRREAAEPILAAAKLEHNELRTAIVRGVEALLGAFQAEEEFVEAVSAATICTARGYLKAVKYSQIPRLPKALQSANLKKFIRDNKE